MGSDGGPLRPPPPVRACRRARPFALRGHRAAGEGGQHLRLPRVRPAHRRQRPGPAADAAALRAQQVRAARLSARGRGQAPLLLQGHDTR